MRAPMTQQPGGGRCDLPLAFGQGAPAFDGGTDAVDDFRRIIDLALHIREDIRLIVLFYRSLYHAPCEVSG